MSSYKTKIKYVLLIIVSLLSLFTVMKSYALDTAPFLYLPFSYKNYRSYQISEAWRYSGSIWYMNTIWTGEYFIHWLKHHSAIDYSLPYGTPVLAPMDWYLVASYHNAFLKDKWYIKMYQGTQLHYGLWWFVQIWNPTNNVFVVLAHMSSIDKSIPVSPPYATWWKKWVSRWDSTGITTNSQKIQEMVNSTTVYPSLVYVKRGQRIWTIWISGLEWDNAMRSEMPTPREPEYPMPVSWDEPHLHMEVFTMQDGEKLLTDPYNMYGDFHWYPDSNTIRTGLGKTLFVQTDKGRIQYADEK